MSRPLVLRACEATTYEGRTLIEAPCGKPGRPWESPSGKVYMVCEHHAEVFSRHFAGGSWGTDEGGE